MKASAAKPRQRTAQPTRVASIEDARAEAIQLVAAADTALATVQRSIAGLKGHLDSSQAGHRDEVAAHTATSEELQAQLDALDKESRAALAAAHESARSEIRKLQDDLRELRHQSDRAIGEKDAKIADLEHDIKDQKTAMGFEISTLRDTLRKVQAQLA